MLFFVLKKKTDYLKAIFQAILALLVEIQQINPD